MLQTLIPFITQIASKNSPGLQKGLNLFNTAKSITNSKK